MASDAQSRWSLEDLVDFEQMTGAAPATPAALRAEIASAVRGLEGAEARRTALRRWLQGMRETGEERRFSTALPQAGGLLALAGLLAGLAAPQGLLDRSRGGMDVSLFLAVLIGGQWLLLVLAVAGWAMRGRAAGGAGAVQALAGKLALRLAGSKDDRWWERLMDGGGAARAAVLWRLARMAQAAGIFFNIGILAGLAGLVLVKHIGFYWETTTELAMRSLLEQTVAILSAPWSAVWPAASPDRAVIEASRWLPDSRGALAPGPAAWWQFLLMTTLVWGLLPRVLLWFMAWHAGRRALGNLDFQGRRHRALWREITGSDRVETDEKPLDGVLVLDVGGSGISETALRPFLLRRLRVHPAAWLSTAVLDAGAEEQAARALAKAPAGVVLLAEGWSLSPPRMTALHTQVRASAGAETSLKFLVANAGADHLPSPASPEEQLVWTQFVDSLRDPAAEVFFYEEAEPPR